MARTYRPVLGTNAYLLLGKYDEALEYLAQESPILRIWVPMTILALAEKGDLEDARERLTAHLTEQPLAQNSSCQLIQLLQAAIILEDHALVADIVEKLTPVADVRIFFFEYSSTARHLGAGCALLGRAEDARDFYKRALYLCSEIGFRPEVALTRLQLAELVLKHYPDEREEAIEHLDFAIAELRAMKMQPALERALRHRGLLKA
jgi:tetratricopeptide (TPR) repeat protein